MASEAQTLSPPHHARRPMNAFLIFCKRHRNVVKERYPQLENRSITKILGEWWAGLDSLEKIDYTNLAKQYKDAFFYANPDFKWYKLPAPSLRMLSTQPEHISNLPSCCSNTCNNLITNIPQNKHNEESYETYDKHVKIEDCIQNDDINTDISDSESEVDLKHKQNVANVFSLGKLADETQLGGLRNLIDVGWNNNNENNKFLCNDNAFNSENCKSHSEVVCDVDFKICEQNSKSAELENALREANSYMANVFDKHKPNKTQSHLHNEPKNNSNELEYLKSSQSISNMYKDVEVQKKYLEHSPRYGITSDCNKNKCNEGFKFHLGVKSTRSCKGKRYEEFKNKGLINARSKSTITSKNNLYINNNLDSVKNNTSRIKEEHCKISVNPDITSRVYNPTCDIILNDYNKNNRIIQNNEDCNIHSQLESGPEKFCHASDFDLDGKIKSLPLLNLEEFLNKKKENKNIRKHIKKHGNHKMLECPYKVKSYSMSKLKLIRNNLNEKSAAISQQVEATIGSKKRKAVKQRITHLETKYNNLQQTNLSGLSTLAEVAAKSSKIEFL